MKEGFLDKVVDLFEKNLEDIVKEQPVSPDYFQFKYSTDNDIGRTFPQAKYVFFTPPIESEYNFDKLPRQHDFNGRVDLKPSAKITDLISSGQGMGMMLSARCFEIMKHFNLGTHKYYLFTCVHKDLEHDYVYLALNNRLMDYIDYSKSVFYISNLYQKHLRDVTFSSKADLLQYIELMNKDKYEKAGYREGLVENDVNLKQVFIKPDFQNLDVITWRVDHFFSKKLADELIANKMTGLRFKETRKIFKLQMS